MRRFRAFSLIEVMVVIAIIAISSAIILPVLFKAREAAFGTKAVTQVNQLAKAISSYAADHDDYFPPCTNYGAPITAPERIWPRALGPYLTNKEVLIAPNSNGIVANTWSERGGMTIGYNSSTSYDPNGCTGAENDTSNCLGFKSTVTSSGSEHPESTALFACTPGGPLSQKYLGYNFSPYNGPVHPDDFHLSAPLCSDRDLVRELTALPAGDIQPVYARYFATGDDRGETPVIFSDGHAQNYTAAAILGLSTGIIWRLR